MDITTRKGELSVGVRILDCDHREISDVINELQAAVARGESCSRTASLLRNLAEFTRSHFALEEEMMAATKYPEMAVHRINHQRIVRQVQAIASRCNRGGLPLSSSSLSFLPEWHTAHLQNDDLHYGLWLNAIGKR